MPACRHPPGQLQTMRRGCDQQLTQSRAGPTTLLNMPGRLWNRHTCTLTQSAPYLIRVFNHFLAALLSPLRRCWTMRGPHHPITNSQIPASASK
mmetsp:Transcript_8866/g.16708  ORF Transcript_8866/g.16708 Transcript_8866/m.16708 type:complete len:94 (+) Transcript_8866:866-1147(+)